MRRAGAYGSWRSPLTAVEAARGQQLTPDWVGFAGAEVWWVLASPEHGGRSQLVRRGPDGSTAPVLPAGWEVRSTMMEYGGRPWAPTPTGGAVFSHGPDQRVYRWEPGRDVVPLSPRPAAGRRQRYCDFTVHGQQVWCLRETLGPEVRRDLVALPLDGSRTVRRLAASHHFLTGPRIDPTGRRVAWLGWDHPQLPWTRTDVLVADLLPDGALGVPHRLDTGPEESVTQVEWRADGEGLLVVSDRSGWWNVHEVRDDVWRPLCPREEEFGEAMWRVGTGTCAALRDGGVGVLHGTHGRHLGVITAAGPLADVETLHTEWRSLASDGTRLAAVAGGPRLPWSVVLVDHGAVTSLWSPPAPYTRYASVPQLRSYDGVPAHVYPPHNPGHRAPDGELPPYLVMAHGGPTSRSQLALDPAVAYFTSRGIGVAAVQYAGSTGHGRAYRQRLQGRWGEADVEDCATVARGLIAEGRADPLRLGFRGASAGGWTALCSLIREPELYRAAAVYFPVLDAAAWRCEGTHDFEARYADWLIGAWPQEHRRYHRRSPAGAAARIRVPFLLMQGLQDAVCPAEQADRLVQGLDPTEVAFRYLRFPREGHGFRQVDTVARCLRAELDMYATAFGFTPAPEPSLSGVSHGIT